MRSLEGCGEQSFCLLLLKTAGYKLKLRSRGFVKERSICFFLCITYIMGTQKKNLDERFKMSTHNISFYGELENIIPELSSNTPH